MNDRLTFRVYSKTRKKYYFINKDNYELDTDIVKEGIEDWDTGENTFIYYKYCELLFADDEDFVKEFSTGLNDKNDKPIFENDIIKYIDSEYGYGGQYDKEHDGYRYLIVPSLTELAIQNCPCEFEDGYFTRGEVVGNLHENPELLEAK